ncbi:MAG: primosomal protein N' [Clostridia bacterium]|nr:primosomal protein N' [Clostridia bacterium]
MIYSVIVDLSTSDTDKYYDYHCDEELSLGVFVKVPFGRITKDGFIIDIKEKSDYETKEILKVYDYEPVIIPEMIRLCHYLKENYLIRYIDSLRLCVPSEYRNGRIDILVKNNIKLTMPYEEAEHLIGIRAKKQIEIIEYLKDKNDGVLESELAKLFTYAQINKLVSKGILEKSEVVHNRQPEVANIESKVINLTDAQKNAIETILNAKKTVLLNGVTGSGKTEIYMNVIENILKNGQNAIMLVPEISLTTQIMALFRNRFGKQIAILHSGLSSGEKYDEWRRIRSGEARIVVGARSAIFAPIKNLGVIIIDEEHDSSYVSENNPRYRTIEIAKFRQKENNSLLVLGSATPSIDSYYLAKNGTYELVRLTSRVNGMDMPEITIKDMREQAKLNPKSVLSQDLVSKIDEVLRRKEQAIIYINRRGYSSFLRCKKCGYIPKCKNCDVSLTYHKEKKQLICHYCGEKYKELTACPVCKNTNLKDGNTGTERVVEELKNLFGNIRILRFDNDTTQRKGSTNKILTEFRQNKADILVGTQMVVKGHDFPNVTLVGVIDADLALYNNNYRCNEVTFQQLTQVSGRAGRDSKKGEVYIQTYNPNHFIFNFVKNYDYDGFYDKEVALREVTDFPPFSLVVKVLVVGKDRNETSSYTLRLYDTIKEMKNNNACITKIKASEAPINRLNDRYRYQVMIWLPVDNYESTLKEIYTHVDKINTGSISAFIDINPINMI